ncbi:MAG TPA: cation:proton antiporter [Candidatus Acidoferrales bacterium]|jgi:Kef-type K+ transport system membrane component KefB|nr:cation:proton antiporter [Candidatus Acidoferrales bacterium]
MKSVLLYLLVLVVFGLGVALTLQQGRQLPTPPSVAAAPAHVAAGDLPGVEPSASLLANLHDNLQDPLPRLFLQLIVIILAARLAGALAVKCHQPAVIGEMIAGILLGPSLLGWWSPDVFHFVFPASSLGSLRLFSQLGVCLFMFVVGMELDLTELRQQARTAVLVSQINILFPYLLGVIAALFLYSSLAGPGISFPVFALFIGISLSLTAFPVLARILQERKLTQTALGTTAIACAATGDVAAWCILAVVVAIAKAQGLLATAFTLGLVVLFVCVMLFWVRPRLPRWIDYVSHRSGTAGGGIIAGVLVFLFASALVTDAMGIHALFGSFLAGLVMPARGELREFLKLRLEHFSAVFLLPLFFAFTGLRTQVGLLNDSTGWLICLGLVVLATVGKLGGTLFAARFTGVNWLDSFSLGALMNTRGLVELIALNIGYDLGILSPRIFAMLVIMALVTTCMTGPLLSIGDHLRARSRLRARAV